MQKRICSFIHGKDGDLFSIYHEPAKNACNRKSILYLHPFADEMNKSRRMAALQARAFSRAGFGVLQIDLFGCGDSSGEFSEARWHIWKENINTAVNWLMEKGNTRIFMWGLRLGALLMMDWAKTSSIPIDSFILWHPVLNGGLAVNQFLRLAATSQIMGKEGKSPKEIRDILNQGQTVEIGGYELHPELAAAIEKQKMEDLWPSKNSRIIWQEISLGDPPDFTPASKKVMDIFKANGCRMNARAISGNTFWNSVEISTVPVLITDTTDIMTGYSS